MKIFNIMWSYVKKICFYLLFFFLDHFTKIKSHSKRKLLLPTDADQAKGSIETNEVINISDDEE